MQRKILAAAALAALLLAACGDDEKTETTDAPQTTEATGYDLSQVEVNDAAKTCADGKTLTAGALVSAPPYNTRS